MKESSLTNTQLQMEIFAPRESIRVLTPEVLITPFVVSFIDLSSYSVFLPLISVYSAGAIFLFTYSLGYATPVVVAGALSGKAAGGLFKSGGASWANSAFASLLIFYGTYTAFDNISKMFLL